MNGSCTRITAEERDQITTKPDITRLVSGSPQGPRKYGTERETNKSTSSSRRTRRKERASFINTVPRWDWSHEDGEKVVSGGWIIEIQCISEWDTRGRCLGLRGQQIVPNRWPGRG